MSLNILIKTSLLTKVKCVVEISWECHPQDSLPRPRSVVDIESYHVFALTANISIANPLDTHSSRYVSADFWLLQLELVLGHDPIPDTREWSDTLQRNQVHEKVFA